ncbi:hypothetical protein IE81DRAFT_322624 [Ceraceosorus guamensis]|uniref:Uncharacterized protein n=1 Tax=Ceraceosorus guamensis TaxID=1522189 RepID=A0A316W084_9BASI|nr:hypothetical protein IE81DRAFT_322624 [Ceraceosorus guamensis]PWN43327.1 hypothetical protein IE81DRAFT_322624 [Ceraceosorus guamensis]
MASSDPRSDPMVSIDVLEEVAFTGRSDVRAVIPPSAFLGSLVPVSLAYILFSTPRLRNQPAFWILGFALVWSWTWCILVISLWHDDIRQIDDEGYHARLWLLVEQNIESWMRPMLVWICDLALIFKILAFYPSQLHSLQRRLCFLIVPFALIHLARLGLLIGVLVTSIQFLYGPLADSGYLSGASTITLAIAQTSLSVVENLACSAILIAKVVSYWRMPYICSTRSTAARMRLKFLLEALLFTFLPATLAQVSLLIVDSITYNTPNITTPLARGQEYSSYLAMVTSMHFGLLAVWWSGIRAQPRSAIRSSAGGSAGDKVVAGETAQTGETGSGYKRRAGLRSRKGQMSSSQDADAQDRSILSYLSVDREGEVDFEDSYEPEESMEVLQTKVVEEERQRQQDGNPEHRGNLTYITARRHSQQSNRQPDPSSERQS